MVWNILKSPGESLLEKPLLAHPLKIVKPVLDRAAQSSRAFPSRTICQRCHKSAKIIEFFTLTKSVECEKYELNPSKLTISVNKFLIL